MTQRELNYRKGELWLVDVTSTRIVCRIFEFVALDFGLKDGGDSRMVSAGLLVTEKCQRVELVNGRRIVS